MNFNTHLGIQGPGPSPLYFPGQSPQFSYPIGQMPQPGFLGQAPYGSRILTTSNAQIFVGDFEETMTGSMLFDYFQNFGKIVQFIFPINHSTKKPKGYAFITYTTQSDAQNAIKSANHQKILNNPIRVLSYKTNFKELPKDANLFLNNLSENITEKDIEDWFKSNSISGIVSCRILYDKGKSKGYGYIQLDSVKTCDEFLENWKGCIKIKDQDVLILRFTPKNQRPLQQNNLWIRNLPTPDEKHTEDYVKKVLTERFSQFGVVSSALVKQTVDRSTNESSYFAFLCFQDGESTATDSAQEALNVLSGEDIFEVGKAIRISFFVNKAERIKKNLINNLYTKYIKEDVKESDVYKIFSRYGMISRYVVRRPKTTFQTQYAMIQYTTKEDMLSALKKASSDNEVKALYQNETFYLNLWINKEERQRIKDAKKKATSINKQFLPPNEQNSYQNENPVNQINPQQLPYRGFQQPQQLGAPTVGTNQMNQIMPINNYNNFGFNSQMQMGSNIMMQGQNNYQQQGNYNKPRNTNRGGGQAGGKQYRNTLPQQNMGKVKINFIKKIKYFFFLLIFFFLKAQSHSTTTTTTTS